LFAVTAPGLMPASTKALKLRDVVGHYPIAIPDHNFVIRRQIDACVRSEQIKFTPALVTNSVEALRVFVRNCGGVTFLPMLAVREDLQTERLIGIPMEDKILREGTIDILVTANHVLPPAACEFVRCLTDLAQRVTVKELQH
jgi:DNA-binding transcriptional LysR family regulator